MTSDLKLDDRLKTFLEASEQERAKGHTIENLQLEVGQIKIDIQEARTDHNLLKYRVDRHGRDIKDIKRKIEFEGDDLDTGQHQVEDLRNALAAKENELKERKEDGLWWKRNAVKWIVGGVAWIFTTLAAAAAANALSRK